MFEPMTVEEIKSLTEPISAEDVLKQFLDKNSVYEDYLLAIKTNTIKREDNTENIEDITRSKPLVDWIMVIDWTKTPLGKDVYNQYYNGNYSFNKWTKLNAAWHETVLNLQDVKSATSRNEHV